MEKSTAGPIRPHTGGCWVPTPGSRALICDEARRALAEGLPACSEPGRMSPRTPSTDDVAARPGPLEEPRAREGLCRVRCRTIPARAGRTLGQIVNARRGLDYPRAGGADTS
ncbi:DUF6233 domain-containing protein [Streptomyces sp. NPDC001889]